MRAKRSVTQLQILSLFLLLACVFSEPAILDVGAEEILAAAPRDDSSTSGDESNTVYRTPRAGEGFHTEIFGHEIAVQASDRRSVSGWLLGLAIDKPTPEDAGILPFGTLYFWRHPDDKSLLRAEISGVYNDIFVSRLPRVLGPLEWVVTFNSFTIPVARSELVDGKSLESEELLWGYVRPGFGLGYRRQVSPVHQDNMFAVDLTLEPGFLFFDRGSKAAKNFVTPDNTVELRTHLQLRVDKIERDLLMQPHEGFAAGADLVYGYRADWHKWGVNGLQDGGHNYLLSTGYFLAAGGVPGVESERHRLVGSVHGGIGSNLDRFSSPRIGGGYRPMGEEYGSTSLPVMPGAAMQEFFPKHYLLAVGEYRWEPVFTTYLSIDGSVGWLDRLRRSGAGDTEIVRKNDVFSSIGARVITGFLFYTRLKLAYNHNFSVIRRGHFGGNEIVVSLSGSF